MAAVLLLLTMMASTATTTTTTQNTAIAAPTSQSSDDGAIKAAQSLHNRIFVGYVILLAITVLTIFLVWWSGNKAQDAIQSNASARIEEAKRAAAIANERAQKLENDNLKLRTDLNTESGKVAVLQKDAADAKAAQQRVETELAKQQERAAIAERALLELQARLAHRRIAPADHDRLVVSLRLYRGSTVRLTKLGDSEAAQFADDIIAVLRDAGWTVDVSTTGMLAPPRYGLLCSIDDGSLAGQSLVAMLRELPTANIQSAPHQQVVGEIVVALRPPP
jgi:hypothetical protein